MNSMRLAAFAFCLLLACQAGAAPAAEAPPVTRRLALIAGMNDGGPSRDRLRYAESDARAMCRTLEELGGVAAADVHLVVAADRETLLSELSRCREKIARIKAGNEKAEIVVYYSGHADEYNLLLGDGTLSYRELQDALRDLGADLCITILDSCASGAFIRYKGSQRSVPFLADRSHDMTGYAVMTSSSSAEASQESDLLRGSFFTHYLISGLRGAADSTPDGRITLSEAYQYAFRETLLNTASSTKGPQHPSYNIRMLGTGDVILTDIHLGPATLLLAEELQGTFYLHQPRGDLIAELKKNPGQRLEFSVDKGKLRVIHIAGAGLWETWLDVPGQGTVRLERGLFAPVSRVDTVARGDRRISRSGLLSMNARPQFVAGISVHHVLFQEKWLLMPGIQLGVEKGNFSVGLLGIGRLQNDDRFPAHPAYCGLFARQRLSRIGPFDLDAGVTAGMGYQRKSDAVSPGSVAPRALFFLLEPRIECSLPITSQLRLQTGLGMAFFTGNPAGTNTFSISLGLILGGRGL